MKPRLAWDLARESYLALMTLLTWSGPPPEMTSANRQWWEVSLVNVCINAVLETNQGLQLGETSQFWSTDNLGALITGTNVPLAHSALSGGQPGSNSSTAIGSTDPLGIGVLLHVTEILVRNIDGVGGYNGAMGKGIKEKIIATGSPSLKVPNASARSFVPRPQPTLDPANGVALVVGDERGGAWQSNEEEGIQEREFW